MRLPLYTLVPFAVVSIWPRGLEGFGLPSGLYHSHLWAQQLSHILTMVPHYWPQALALDGTRVHVATAYQPSYPTSSQPPIAYPKPTEPVRSNYLAECCPRVTEPLSPPSRS